MGNLKNEAMQTGEGLLNAGQAVINVVAQKPWIPFAILGAVLLNNSNLKIGKLLNVKI